MNTHYVCTGGCKGVSEDANATCQAVDCPKHTHPLIPCNCADGEHKEAYEGGSANTAEGEAQ